MLYEQRTVDLGGGEAIEVGFTMCFSPPACQVLRVRRASTGQAEEVATLLRLSRDQLDSVIAALQAVRDAMLEEAR